VILADTSIWIELLNGKLGRTTSEQDVLGIVTCGPIVQEVLQGIRHEPAYQAFRDSFLALPRLCDPLTLNVFLKAAEIYRGGRRRGFTIRSSTDCLIAAIAIENDVPLWHRDRDYSVIAAYTNLQAVDRP
jgi:predicted nucleic acid-binding protein